MSRLMIRIALVSLAFVLVAASGASVAVAQFQGECEQECVDAFGEDLQECSAAYNERLGEIEAEYQTCIAGATSIIDRVSCLLERRGARDQALSDRRRCEASAQSEAVRCLLACASSPAAP